MTVKKFTRGEHFKNKKPLFIVLVPIYDKFKFEGKFALNMKFILSD